MEGHKTINISAVALQTDKNSNVILAAADQDNFIHRWDMEIAKKAKEINSMERTTDKFKIKWSPDSNSFVVVYIQTVSCRKNPEDSDSISKNFNNNRKKNF